MSCDGRNFPRKSNWQIHACSPPFCSFRNASNYNFKHNQFYNELNMKYKKSAFKAQATNQTLFFMDQLSEYSCPSGLIYDTLLSESSSPTFNQNGNWSSIYSTSIDNQPVMIHTAGEQLDKLVIRDPHFSHPGFHRNEEPGFIVNLGNGEAIQQIINAGKTHFGTTSNILCRTSTEVFYSSIVNLASELDNSRSQFIIDPKAKYALPESISSITSTNTHLINATLITEYGNIYSWSPIRGFTKSLTISVDLANEKMNYLIESTLHPMISFYSKKDTNLFQCDLRTDKSHQLTSFSSSIHSIKQHGFNPELFTVCDDTAISLIDQRYPKTHLMKRLIPHSYSQLKYYNFPIGNLSEEYFSTGLDIFLGADSFKSQIHLHSLDSYNSQSIGLSPLDHSYKYRSYDYQQPKIDSFSMLNTMSPFPSESLSYNWNIEGFPIVDPSNPLLGIDLIPLIPFLPEKSVLDTIQTSSQNNDTNAPSNDYNFLLAQQNFIGDVFIQKIRWNPYQDRHESKTMNEDEEIEIQRSSNHMDEDITSESIIGSHLGIIPTATNLISSKQTFPPIQINLCNGLRCFSPKKLKISSYTFICKEELSKLLPFYPKEIAYREVREFSTSELNSIPGYSLQVMTSLFDKDITQTPLISSQFNRFISEDTLSSFDLIGLFPQDLRSDLPVLRGTSIYNIMKLPPQPIDNIRQVRQSIEDIEDNLESFITPFPKTFWEIWKFILDSTSQRISHESLQHFLKFKYHESHLPSRIEEKEADLIMFYSDGNYVSNNHLPTENNLGIFEEKEDDIFEVKDSQDEESSSSNPSKNFGCTCKNISSPALCEKRDCIEAHRILYSNIPNENSFVSTQSPAFTFSSNSIPFSQFTQDRKRSDVTDDLCSALMEKWSNQKELVTKLQAKYTLNR